MDLLQGTVNETACPYDIKYLAQHVPGAAKVFRIVAVSF